MLEILYKLWDIFIGIVLLIVLIVIFNFIYDFIKIKIFRIRKKVETTEYKTEDRYSGKRKLNTYDDYDKW